MEKNEKNRELILKALVDPEFRKILEVEPLRALELEEITEVNKQEVRLILAAVRGINIQITAAADELLCAYGPGPCGIC
ncbi:MAG: hypothetical protein PVF58_07405 [Candidatus Methanofastidiosia archaeon]|jgi:hypothetical protein